MMSPNETIAAIATPPGVGGVGVIRISGANALTIGEAITGQRLVPRHVSYAAFRDAERQIIDRGIVIYFESPHSYTGDSVIELQGHGGIQVMQTLLKTVLSMGARQAKPGEFTERAFLNGKMDLVQAEAVADLIESRSQSAAKAAIRSLSGEFSSIVDELQSVLIGLRVYIEAALDFSDEEIDFLSEGRIAEQLESLLQRVQKTLQQANYGKILQEGAQVVLVGEPNVGKSSLMNRLLGQDRAIVTAQAGTTRDTIEETVIIQGVPIRITDTAGLREADDMVERAGIERTKKALHAASLAIWLRDSQTLADEKPEELAHIPYIEVHNKQDLVASSTPNESTKHFGNNNQPNQSVKAHEIQSHPCLSISAKTGEGIDQLLDCIAERVIGLHHEEGVFSARERHIEALKATEYYIQQALAGMQSSLSSDLVAEELRLAQQHLSEITGEFTSDDLLGEIFGQFCIGK